MILEALGLSELFDFTASASMAHTFGIAPSDPTTKVWIAIVFLGLIAMNMLNVADATKKRK